MLGGFAATLLKLGMTKHSWVGGGWTGRAVVCLAAALWAMSAMAAHPVRYAEAPVGHHARRVAQTAPKAKAGKNSARKTKSRAAAPAAKASPKAGHHKRHRAAEADNDPPMIYRTGKHVRRPRSKPMQAVAERREPAAAAPTDNSPDDLLAMSEDLTAADFKHGNDASAAPKTAASADSDERLSGSPVVATASAVPDAAAALPARGRRKVSPFPEDQADRAALVQEIVQPVVLRPLYTRSGRLIVPPPMKGSREILVHQNTMADSEGLDRIQDDTDLDRMREAHLLVPLDDSRALLVNPGLPENRRYARPWTARFALDTARAFYARFHRPLILTSAVRTVEYQLRLQQVNGNAAAVDGDAASPHLTGQALDFGKHGMSIAQIAWMRAYLGPLMQAGRLDVEEEFQQACFHISVYRNYAPILKPRTKAAPKMEMAQTDLPVHAALRVRTLR
jgi:Family of unknown function (DUF5715)